MQLYDECRVAKEISNHDEKDSIEYTTQEKLDAVSKLENFPDLVQDAINESCHGFDDDKAYWETIGKLSLDSEYSALGTIIAHNIREYLADVGERSLNGERF